MDLIEDHKNHFLYKRIQSTPRGKVMLAIGLEKLLAQKDFNSITTAEIARASGINESLIYRYFGEKRGLLHYILAEHQTDSLQLILSDLAPITGAVNKLKKIIWRTIDSWSKDRVYAKILLIEVRNSPAYYQSETYLIIKKYCQLIQSIIQEGKNNGEISGDVSPWFLMQVILGSIEHVVLPSLIFDKKFDVELFAENIYRIVFRGVLTADG
ncbi:MAG: TetR/AcrR family transcriptional regulator [Pseudomonadota bacterium]